MTTITDVALKLAWRYYPHQPTSAETILYTHFFYLNDFFGSLGNFPRPRKLEMQNLPPAINRYARHNLLPVPTKKSVPISDDTRMPTRTNYVVFRQRKTKISRDTFTTIKISPNHWRYSREQVAAPSFSNLSAKASTRTILACRPL